MSYPAISHVQYRLIEQDGETTLQFCHRAIGEIDASHREGVEHGWNYQLQQLKQHAESTS